jgi:hypothetical protein
MKELLQKTWVFPILALLVQVLGLWCYRWSWLASFGPVRTLPEAWDITAPMLILGVIGVIGSITSLVAIHRLVMKARWWIAAPVVLLMVLCAWWSGVCLYAVCIFGGLV